MVKITTISELEAKAADGSIGRKPSLFLHDQGIDDRMVERVAAALTRLDASMDAITITLSRNRISDAGAQVLAGALSHMIQQSKLPPRLHLALYNNQIGCRGATALATTLQSAKLSHLLIDLTSNTIMNDGAQAILGITPSHTASRVLDLKLGDNPAELSQEALIAALWPTIRRQRLTLDLSDIDKIDGNDVTTAMSYMVRENKNLPEMLDIELPPNTDDDGARTLYEMLTLKAAEHTAFGLSFNYCPDITSDGVGLLAQHLNAGVSANNLRKLSLLGCTLTPEVITTLLDALQARKTPKSSFELNIAQLNAGEPGEPSDDEVTLALTTGIKTMLESGQTPPGGLTLLIGDHGEGDGNHPVLTHEQVGEIASALDTATKSGKGPHKFSLSLGSWPTVSAPLLLNKGGGSRWNLRSQFNPNKTAYAGYYKGPFKSHPRPTLPIPNPSPGLFGRRSALADFERTQFIQLLLCNNRQGVAEAGTPRLPSEMWLAIFLCIDTAHYREGFVPPPLPDAGAAAAASMS